jgi:phosphoribosylformylglycinamidine synthase
MKFKATINIYLKEGVLDSQGKAVHHALDSLGFTGVDDVRIGRQVVIKLDANSESEASDEVKNMCESLLANTVIEDFSFDLTEEK